MAISTVQSFAIAMLITVLTAIAVESAITCNEVENTLSKCLDYAKSGGELPPACCDGVKMLKEATHSIDEHIATCECFKAYVNGTPGIDEELMKGIPKKCAVDIGYPTTFTVDCSTLID